jgi:soluble lytic murein transglycosylase-like protein
MNHILKTAAVAPGRGRTHEPPDGPSFRQILEATSHVPNGFPGQWPPLSKEALLEVIRIVQAQMNQSLLRAMSAEAGDDRDIRLPFLSDRLFPLNRASPERHFEKQRQAGLRSDSETSASPAPHPVIPPEREPLKPASARRHPDDQGRRMDLDPIIQEAAAVHGIDPELIKSVIRVESNFDPNSTSPKGAMGLMQLMPGTARELGVQNAYDPAENIRAGTRYLNMLLNRYEGNVTMALAAYNWGMGNLERRPAQMPLETKSYIRSVIRHFEQAKA